MTMCNLLSVENVADTMVGVSRNEKGPPLLAVLFAHFVRFVSGSVREYYRKNLQPLLTSRRKLPACF